MSLLHICAWASPPAACEQVRQAWRRGHAATLAGAYPAFEHCEPEEQRVPSGGTGFVPNVLRRAGWTVSAAALARHSDWDALEWLRRLAELTKEVLANWRPVDIPLAPARQGLLAALASADAPVAPRDLRLGMAASLGTRGLALRDALAPLYRADAWSVLVFLGAAGVQGALQRLWDDIVRELLPRLLRGGALVARRRCDAGSCPCSGEACWCGLGCPCSETSAEQVEAAEEALLIHLMRKERWLWELVRPWARGPGARGGLLVLPPALAAHHTRIGTADALRLLVAHSAEPALAARCWMELASNPDICERRLDRLLSRRILTSESVAVFQKTLRAAGATDVAWGAQVGLLRSKRLWDQRLLHMVLICEALGTIDIDGNTDPQDFPKARTPDTTRRARQERHRAARLAAVPVLDLPSEEKRAPAVIDLHRADAETKKAWEARLPLLEKQLRLVTGEAALLEDRRKQSDRGPADGPPAKRRRLEAAPTAAEVRQWCKQADMEALFGGCGPESGKDYSLRVERRFCALVRAAPEQKEALARHQGGRLLAWKQAQLPRRS